MYITGRRDAPTSTTDSHIEMSKKIPPWLEELSDDWPSDPSTMSEAGTLKSGTHHPSNRRSRKSGSLNSKKQEGGRIVLGDRNENAVVFNQANASLKADMSPEKQCRSLRRQSQELTDGGTVQQKACRASPPGKNHATEIPEWKKRLIYGEMAYDEQKDLFSPIGLENIFQQVSRAGERSRRSVSRDYKQHPEKGNSHKHPKYGQLLKNCKPKCASEQRQNGQKSASSSRMASVSTCSSGSRTERANATAASFREGRIVSGQTELNEDFSPVIVSRHGTVDGKIDYATRNMTQEQAKQGLLSLPRSHGISKPTLSERNQYDKSQVSMLSEDLSMGTPDMAELGDFVTCKRGGCSTENSFQDRPLSPSPNRQSQSHMLATQLPNYSCKTQTETQRIPVSPRTPDNYQSMPQSQRSLVQPLNSPLKLFGNYDTFTNHQLMRRMDQLQGVSEQVSIDGRSENLSSAGLSFSSVTQQDESFTTFTKNEHGVKAGSVQSQREASIASNYKVREGGQLPCVEQMANNLSVNNLKTSSPGRAETAIGSEIRLKQRRGLTQSKLLDEMVKPNTCGTNTQINNKCAVDTLAESLSQFDLQKCGNMPTCADGKRPQSSPTKSPTPKRRRTLLQMETSSGIVPEIQPRQEDTIRHNCQKMLKQKTPPSNVAEHAESGMPLQPHSIQPNEPPSSHRRKEVSASSEFCLQGPRSELEPISEHGEFLALPKEIVAQDSQRASTENDHARANLQAESRKHSLTTQDYIDEAMKIMSWIRSNRPKSGLGSLEEAEGELLNESLTSAASMTLSRPPSREGRTSKWREPNSHRPPSRVISHLKKYKESESEDNVLPSLAALNIADVQHDTEYRPNDSNTIRITHRCNLADNHTEEGAAQVLNQPDHLDAHNSDNSDKFSSGRTNVTDGSRKSENVTTFAPDAVAHLIPQEIAGMTFDKEKGLWVKSQNSPNKKSSNECDLSVTESDEDPFDKIPDLIVDAREYNKSAPSIQSSHTLRSTSTLSEEALKDVVAKLQNKNERKTQRDLRDGIVNYRSTVDRTRIVSNEITVPPTISPQEKSRKYVDAEHEYSMDEGRVRTQRGLQGDRRNVTFSFPTRLVAQVPLLEDRRNSWQHYEISAGEDLRNIDLSDTGRGKEKHYAKGSAFRQEKESVVSNAQKLPMECKSPDKDHDVGDEFIPLTNKFNHNHKLAISLTTPSRQSGAVVTATTSPGNVADVTFYLSELPEFSVNQLDERGTHEQVHGNEVVRYSKDPNRRFEISTGELVRVLQDARPEEPYWEDINHLMMDDKELQTLHSLDNFCPRLQALSIARNSLRHLSGASPSIRQLNVSQNQLSALTTWTHLTNLQYLDVSGNEIDSLAGFADLIHLRELRADNNKITSIDGIFGLDALIKLSVSGNRIDEIDFTHSNLYVYLGSIS